MSSISRADCEVVRKTVANMAAVGEVVRVGSDPGGSLGNRPATLFAPARHDQAQAAAAELASAIAAWPSRPARGPALMS
jgi:hypothetical protein